MKLKIALVHWSDRLVGGQETYVAMALQMLATAGHDLLFCHETEAAADQSALRVPPVCRRVSAASSKQAALSALTAWRPDVLFVNSLLDPELEAAFQQVAPAVFFAHSYYGTCISGTKSFSRPGATRPCTRQFGPACLALYLPRGCGGRNPLTMLREYGLQARRLSLLRRYKAIITASEHMRREYLNHGFSDQAVHMIHYPALPPPGPLPPDRTSGRPLNRLLFMGRMDRTKGGTHFLNALPEVRDTLRRPLSVTMAGDGPEHGRWVKSAADITAVNPDIHIDFPGWIGAEARRNAFDQSDLLVVPSLWPEPFGLVGLEAGHRGLPAAAFAVGGIPDWLNDNVNGRLANANPPTATGLARAICGCLLDAGEYSKLSIGARRQAARFTTEAHIQSLQVVLRSAAVAR